MAYKVINGKLTKVVKNSHKFHNRIQAGLNTQLRFHNNEPDPEPNHALKGHYRGRCNRTACQSPEAVVWYNTGTHQYYCWYCAYLINTDGCQRFNSPNICHRVTGFNTSGEPQFDPTLPLTQKRDYHPTEEDLDGL